MAQGVKLPRNPLELLENDGSVERPFITKVWGPSILGLIGFCSVVVGNYATKRPIFSGIQKHIIATGGGVAIGKWLDDYRDQYLADRDAVYRHYITLHPEDFPDYERKKLGQVFESWTPVR